MKILRVFVRRTFSQLLRDFSRKKTQYSKEWKAFERMWQRPAIAKAHMKDIDGRNHERR